MEIKTPIEIGTFDIEDSYASSKGIRIGAVAYSIQAGNYFS